MGPENIWVVAIGGFCSFVASVLYAIGGTEMSFGGKKWIRRYLGSFILALGANIVAFMIGEWSWKLLLMYPCLIGGMSLGYGGDKTSTKVLKRAIFALGCLSACMVGVWYCGWVLAAWIVFGIAFVVASVSVVLGVWNPFKNAPLEQYIICQVLTMFVPFWAFVIGS